MKVVLDTNVIVSGLNFPGNERRVLELARTGRFDMVISPFIVNEVVGVLIRKFGWEELAAARAIRLISDRGTFVEPRRTSAGYTGHDADDRILDCSVESEADYLVTGDRRHLLPLGTH